ncbi:hypothetical protein ANN_01870 [Periplaneta americana]|uniref:Uncharacterized protein n=1 Tax=Periplaneta americana TaxID=6978 RepID=A0ABQ8TUQ9_PERAM|nr:hypothetical protein ANN_01870 [Periplaneta americana]
MKAIVKNSVSLDSVCTSSLNSILSSISENDASLSTDSSLDLVSAPAVSDSDSGFLSLTVCIPPLCSSPNLVTTSSAVSNGNHLVKKVPNKSCTLPSMGFSSSSAATNHKKPIELSHLPKRPPVDIQFTNLAYSVSEGRKRDFSCAAQQLNASQSTHRFSFVNHTIKTVNMPKCAVSSTQKFLVQQHITTSKHQANKQLNSKQRQLFLTQPTTSNVEEIMETLGLVECCDTRTTNLSGGQRKRLSIALELVNNPPVMFFDEPTRDYNEVTTLFPEVLANGVAEHKSGGVVAVPGVNCNTSLLDSDESLNHGKQNTGFPTSSFLQFYILLKRTFLSTMRDQIVFSVIYVMIVYFMTSQPPEMMRFMMLLTMCILTSLVAQSLGLLIGAAMSVENGVFFGPVASVPILLFSGFFVNFNTIPGYLQWVPYISYIRYGFEGAMISIYGYGREKLSCSEAYCHFRNPTKFLEEMDMATAEYWIDAAALAGFFLLLRCVAYFVLRLKLRSKK